MEENSEEGCKVLNDFLRVCDEPEKNDYVCVAGTKEDVLRTETRNDTPATVPSFSSVCRYTQEEFEREFGDPEESMQGYENDPRSVAEHTWFYREEGGVQAG
jgi:hypothetical protein